MSAAAFDYAPPFHQCSCGQAYTKAQWLRLRCVGVQRVPALKDDPAYGLEMRDCVMCGSTRCVPVEEEQRP